VGSSFLDFFNFFSAFLVAMWFLPLKKNTCELDGLLLICKLRAKVHSSRVRRDLAANAGDALVDIAGVG
jgi:hypothetical protein